MTLTGLFCGENRVRTPGADAFLTDKRTARRFLGFAANGIGSPIAPVAVRTGWPVAAFSGKHPPMLGFLLPPLLAAALVLPYGAMAQSPMTGDEFDAYVTGHTFTYAEDGTVYGIEEYHPNRRVRWKFLDGELGGRCSEGLWYESGEQICFLYENIPSPQCWTFVERAGRLTARFESGGDGMELYEIERSDRPLTCPGPDVGV